MIQSPFTKLEMYLEQSQCQSGDLHLLEIKREFSLAIWRVQGTGQKISATEGFSLTVVEG
jgi:hypothetical protein